LPLQSPPSIGHSRNEGVAENSALGEQKGVTSAKERRGNASRRKGPHTKTGVYGYSFNLKS